MALDCSVDLAEEEQRLEASLARLDVELERRRLSSGASSCAGGSRFRASSAPVEGRGSAFAAGANGAGSSRLPSEQRAASASRVASRLRSVTAAACDGVDAVPCKAHGLVPCALCAAAAARPPQPPRSQQPPQRPVAAPPKARARSAGSAGYGLLRMNRDMAITSKRSNVAQGLLTGAHVPPVIDGRQQAAQPPPPQQLPQQLPQQPVQPQLASEQTLMPAQHYPQQPMATQTAMLPPYPYAPPPAIAALPPQTSAEYYTYQQAVYAQLALQQQQQQLYLSAQPVSHAPPPQPTQQSQPTEAPPPPAPPPPAQHERPVPVPAPERRRGEQQQHKEQVTEVKEEGPSESGRVEVAPNALELLGL